MATIRPFDLPPASSISNIDAFVTDDGISVQKVTIQQIGASAAPFASQAQAEAGVATDVYMNPKLTADAIAAQAVTQAALSSNAGALMVGTDSGQTVQDVLNSLGGLSTVMNVAVDYTLNTADAGKYIRIGNVTPLTITAQDDATYPLPPYIEFNFRAVGDVSFSPTIGVTINPPNGGTLDLEDGMTVTLKRVATDEFDLVGQTVPV